MNIKNLAKMTVGVVGIAVFTLTFKQISNSELNKKNASLGAAQASVETLPEVSGQAETQQGIKNVQLAEAPEENPEINIASEEKNNKYESESNSKEKYKRYDEDEDEDNDEDEDENEHQRSGEKPKAILNSRAASRKAAGSKPAKSQYIAPSKPKTVHPAPAAPAPAPAAKPDVVTKPAPAAAPSKTTTTQAS